MTNKDTNVKLSIATLRASLGGGYTDTLKVWLDCTTHEFHLEVTAGLPRGGMDGDPTPFYRVTEAKVLPPGTKPATLLKEVKRIISNKGEHLFKEYGKPTKNMAWCLAEGWEYGLNIALCTAAVAHARDCATHD
jgi:hypothetical protein